MATLGKWSGAAVNVGDFTTSWATDATDFFGTEDRNDGSAYGHASANAFSLPSSDLADGYLLLGAYETEDDSNGRYNPQAKIIQTSGTGTFVGGPTGGYSRDSSEDRAYVRCWAFVDNPSASAAFAFQVKRDNDSTTSTCDIVRSEFQIIPFFYADIGLYTSTDTTNNGGTTPNVVTGFTGTDGTNITIASNVISCTGDNKRYMILGSQFYEGREGRTQRWHGLDIDGTQEDAAKAYSFYRSTSDDESGDLFTWLIETATATVTIEQTCYRGDGVSNLQGGASVDEVAPAVGAHAMVVIELNDTAEVFRSRDTNQSALLATTGPVDLDINETMDFNDTASFTDLVVGSVNCVQTADYIFGANIAAASNSVGDGTRWTAYAEQTVNGTEDADSFGGDYLRNNQGTEDTFGWSANLLGFQALTAGDDWGVSVTELSGSEGGGAAVSPAGWSGAWGVNLDTLEDAGGTPRDVDCTTPPALDIARVNSTVNATRLFEGTLQALNITSPASTINASRILAGTLEVLAATEAAATVLKGKTVESTSASLTLSEQASTVNATRLLEGTTAVLTLAEQASTVNATRLIDATATSLTASVLASTVVINRSFTTVLASLTASTLASTVNATRLVEMASPPALATATFQANLDLDKVVEAVLATLSIAEQNATVTRVLDVDGTLATLTITALVADVTTGANLVVSCTVEVLAATEQVATINRTRETEATLATLTATALASTAQLDKDVDGTAASLGVTMLTADLNRTLELDTALATLSAATSQATAALVREVVATAATLNTDTFKATLAGPDIPVAIILNEKRRLTISFMGRRRGS